MNAVTWVKAKTNTRSKNSSNGATLACSVPRRTEGWGACIPAFCPRNPPQMFEARTVHHLRTTAIIEQTEHPASATYLCLSSWTAVDLLRQRQRGRATPLDLSDERMTEAPLEGGLAVPVRRRGQARVNDQMSSEPKR